MIDQYKEETATFAAGCFWGVEEAFRKVKGVTNVTVGYTGGYTENPTYENVCTGTTGHVEAVRITFDPEQISYRELLDVFWSIHDPTSYAKQGPDTGSQYRSMIFYNKLVQQKEAEQSKEELADSGTYNKEIVTEIVPLSAFYKAEEYHQRYFEKKRAQ